MGYIPGDSDLVRRARFGDHDAFGALVTRHQRSALALARSLVFDDAEAEDLTQEAFLRALRNLDLLADAEKFAPWLHRIVFGTCIDWLRAFRPGLYQSSTATDDDLLNLDSATPTPLVAAERAELSERVAKALAEWPEKYRIPFHLYHLDGLSHERVAEALGVPVATVRSLVHRARQKLAQLLPDLRDDDASLFDAPAMPHTMLHILNGDSTRMSLEQSSVPGTFSVWADVYYEGPVPRDVSDRELVEIRSRFHAGERFTYKEALAMGTRWLDGLESYREHDEVVIWCEHDLFDQMLLINLLDFFARQSVKPRQLSLICIGEFPAVVPFHGLGQLDADQLASLLDTRQRVSERQLALGQSAWRAFTGDDPTALERLLARDTSPLPFLDGALRRLLEDFPDARTGLPRTERTLLELLAKHGPLKFAKLFPLQQQTEERVFAGDTTILDRLDDLARDGLVEIVPDSDERQLDVRIAITDVGKNVLAGERDWMSFGAFDRWIGGSQLRAPRPAWRWNREDGRLMPASPIQSQ
jgi:RNA polymerase sigma factor (sigma-70 family)